MYMEMMRMRNEEYIGILLATVVGFLLVEYLLGISRLSIVIYLLPTFFDIFSLN